LQGLIGWGEWLVNKIETFDLPPLTLHLFTAQKKLKVGKKEAYTKAKEGEEES